MKILVFILIAVMLTACNGSKNKLSGVEVPFDSLAHNMYCSIDAKRQVVLQNKADYQKLWDEIYMNLDQMPRVPDVDFGKFTVVAVFMGIKNTGGFDIRIDRISTKEDKLLVDFTETSPGVNCMVTDAITKPYDFVKIKKTDKQFEFKTHFVTKDCP